MHMAQTSLFLPGILSLLLFGCIESPLLNHADAHSDGKALNQENPLETETCAFHFPRSELCASLEWEKKQSAEGKGSFIVRFWDSRTGSAKGPFISPSSEVRIELWMTSMGHGTWPKPATSPVLDSDQLAIPGVFRTENVYFMMPGPWDIRLQLFEGENLFEQAHTPYVQPSW
jgi:hypothetical protein